MTIRKRLAHSNIVMLVIPLLTAAVLALLGAAAVLVLLGAAVVLVLLQTVWGVGYRLRKDNEPS